MRKMLKSILVFLLLHGCFNLSHAQDKPSDFVDQLPEIFTAVCTAGNAEVQAYGGKLGTFSRTVQARLDSLAALKIKSRSGMKVKANADTSQLERQLKKTEKLISKTDYSVKFDKALHTEAEKIIEQRLDEINKKADAASDYRVLEALLAETKRVRSDYCQAASPHFIELLVEQRAILENDVTAIVTAADLSQQIHCRTLGFIYFPELSYENAYLRILDHLKYMNLLLSFCPGNE
ncbi:MAG: hypothetical protein E4H23_09655 [Chrysiogenales bacterium]|nr:MAG: hypothetical protein E4H23_09655 [Chrysiogenales bacterium]